MSQQTQDQDNVYLDRWYRFAADQPGFVGGWLRFLRERQHQTSEQQRKDFGVNSDDFVRLQGMLLPRSFQFTRDARRIAEACRLTNPERLVQALLLARSLIRTAAQGLTDDTEQEAAGRLWANSEYYQAAFDEDKELDEPPEEE
jgi:hypothetical protein